MVAMAPMLSAILASIFLKEPTNKETWVAIFVTFFLLHLYFMTRYKLEI